jgi:hypothetical protein
VNVRLHVANALLLGGARRWPSGAAAAVSPPPVHVESVAWITDAEPALGAFYLGALLTFLRGTGWKAYAGGTLLFAGALLSVVMTFPGAARAALVEARAHRAKNCYCRCWQPALPWGS